MTASRIVLWRHGRTAWNRRGPLSGSGRHRRWTRSGWSRPRRAAPMLAGFEPVALYSSDLSRAYQTAEALADFTGLEIVTDKRLREIDVGSWEGLLGAEVRAQHPDLAQSAVAGRGRPPLADGGEPERGGAAGWPRR